jgi:hypothetical protein
MLKMKIKALRALIHLSVTTPEDTRETGRET